MSLCFVLWTFFYHTLWINLIYFLLSLYVNIRLVRLLVLGLYKEDYLQIFKCASFLLHSFCGKWQGWDPVTWFNSASWKTVVTQTGRRKSVRNHCVIVLGGVFVFWHVSWLSFSDVMGLLSYDWVRYLPFFSLKSLVLLLEHNALS